MIAALVLAATIAAPPRPADYVTDNAGALSSGTVERLDTELRNYEEATQHRVIVWIGQTTGDESLEDWTIRAAAQWKIGRKGKDDGAILFLFMRDRRIRIEVGYGLEPSLTDADSSRIINETIRPQMRAGNVDAAVQDGVDRMLLTITPSFASRIGHAVAAQPETSTAADYAWVLLALGFVFFAILLSFLRRHKGRHGGGYYPGLWFFGSGGGGGGGFGGGFGGGGFGGGFGGGGASGGW